jgi:hypothetical protein
MKSKQNETSINILCTLETSNIFLESMNEVMCREKHRQPQYCNIMVKVTSLISLHYECCTWTRSDEL